ncbi:MAG: N-acetylmuramoyl-L-alanine amidase [Rubrobacteraceae bacterium]
MRYITIIFAALSAAAILCSAGSAPGMAEEESLAAEFRAASEEHGVPEELLLAMGYVNTRWEMPPPGAGDYEEGEIDARGNYGVMSLYQNPSRNTLGRAAELTGLSEEELKTRRAANVRGGAAVLAEIQGQERPAGLNGWHDAVAEYGGGSLYARQVYEVLESGASAAISTGERVELAPQPEAEQQEMFTTQSTADYAGATWYGAYWNGYSGCYDSINFCQASRPVSNDINKVIVHVTQGSWAGAMNWFKDPAAGVSAHYTVRSGDGFIGQSVDEEDIAYHAGNWEYNQTSIGIEHEGYVGEPSWFTDAMYRSSAKLTAYLCKKYGIPMDRTHIIGHNEVPGATHTDPGAYWNWTRYMDYVREYAGVSGGGTAYTQTVDNASSRFGASGAWGKSSYSSQRYGKNYRFARPGNVTDPVRFRVRLPSDGSYAVAARWPANSGYNSRARFRIETAAGRVTRTVNQRQNGGRWVGLGVFEMKAGDRAYVSISRKSSAKGYIIADAIRVTRQ